MNRPLFRTKLFRDIRRQRAQFVGIVVTIACGIALFGGTYDAYRSLRASYSVLYDQLAFADVWVAGGDTTAVAAEARTVAGVEAVETRTEGEVAMRIGGDHKLLGGVIGMPVEHQPRVNRLKLLDGEYLAPGTPTSVVLERHVADHFDLGPGDRVELRRAGRWQPVEVRGVAASAEYVWAARNRQDVLTSPEEFGVVFAPEMFARDLVGEGGIARAVVRFDPDAGVSAARLEARIRGITDENGAVDVFTRAEQPSNHALQADVEGFGELSFLFPVLFLTAAGLGTWVLLTRIVLAQRSTIGMLLANGVRRRAIFRHYLSFGLLAGIAGVVPGAALGMLLAWVVAGAYTSTVGVPITVLRLDWATPLVGLAFAMAATAISAAVPAVRAIRMEPADAMRGPTPAGPGRLSVLERLAPPLRRLPSGGRLVLRNLERNRRRTATTAVGVVLACTLVLTAWGMIDTFNVLVDRQFDEIQHDDARVTLAGPIDREGLARVGGVDGVAAVEPVVAIPVGLEANGQRYGTSILAFERDTRMHSFGSGGLPEDGLLLGQAARSLLDVRAGDDVRVLVPTLGRSVEERVAGFVDEPLGTYAYATIAQVEARARELGVELESSELPTDTVLVTYESGVDREVMRERLTNLSGVVVVQDTHSLLEAVRELMALIYVLVGIMLAFGVILAVALVYNTMSVNIAERSVETATLAASGVREGTLARLILSENLLVAVLAVGPGLLVGWLTAREFMASFSNDQFNFALALRAFTLPAVAAGVLVVTWLSQLPGVRRLRRLDIQRIVRERSV